MKKVIFGLAVVAAAALGVYSANTDNAMAQMSDLQMENVEALGQEVETTPINPMCETGCLDRAGNGCFCMRFWPDLARP